MSERREHAQRYRSMNMEPLPIPAGSKGPTIPKWQNGVFGIDAFNGGGNIGLLTGEIGHGLVCVDLDCEEAIELAPEYLPGTPAVVGRDTRPGCHWFYRCSQPGKKLAFKDPTTGGVVVEVLASGQQVVVGPSSHPEGGEYEPLTKEPAAIDRADVDRAVRQLHNAVLEKRGHVVSDDNTADEVAHPTGNTAEGIRPGDDYRKRGHDHLRNTLEQNGWKHTRKTPDGNEHWERPGKDKQETSATFKDGVFYVFSSNAQGFEPESSNSMFHSYATLEHGGDHSAAARELAEQGYGKPKPNPSESKPFPVEALSPAWAEWVTENANAKNIPCEMLALPALSAASAAISNMVLASPWDGWIEPSMVWTVVVAPSGSMKSPPFREAVRGAFEQQRKHDAIHSQDRDAYKVEERRWKVLLKAWEKDGAEGDAPTEPRRPQPQTFVLTDTTSEAVIQAAAESARGVLIANDELSQWFERQGAYKSGRGAGGDDGVWNAAFNGDFYGEGRKTTGRTSVARFSVCVAGTIQPGVLRACGTRRNQESGLLARFLPAMVEPPPPTYTGKVMPGYVENEYLSAVEKLYEVSADAAGEPVLLRFSDDAKGGFIPWHDQYGREHTAASKADPMYAAAVSKLRGYAVRIALVLTMTDWACSPSGLDNPQPTSIGVEAVQRACRIVDWFKAQWRDVLDMLSMDEGAASDEAMCWGFIMKNDGATTVRAMTHDGPGAMRGGTDAARKWLDRQVDAGLMKCCPRPPGPKGGRPTEEYRVCARQDAE